MASLKVAGIAAIVAVTAASSLAAPFTPGNLVVVQIGDEQTSVTDSASPVYLKEFAPAAPDGTFVHMMPLPTAVSGPNRRLTLSADFRAGMLTRSDDGRFLVLGGFDADVGTPLLVTTLAIDVARVIGRIDQTGNINTTTALTDCYFGPDSKTSFRSACSSDGTKFWTTGRDGSGDSSFARVRFTTLGAATSVVLNNGEPKEPRVANVYGGRLYVSTNVSGSGTGQYRGVGTGTNAALPEAPLSEAFNKLPGYAAPDGTETKSPYDFLMLDLDPNVAGVDTLYVADDRTPSSFGGLEKFVFDGAAWNYRYTLSVGLNPLAQALQAVTGAPDGNGHVVLYGVTHGEPPTPNWVVTVVDTGCPTGDEPGCTSADAFTVFQTAPAGTIYRGIRFTPDPCIGPDCIGACCMAGNACAVTDQASCEGVWLGLETTCETANCPLVCPDPFADADLDTDVDSQDFAAWQRCFGAGAAGPLPGECACFDRPEVEFPEGNGIIDATDLNAFLACGSGPEVAAAKSCDDPAP